MDDRTEKSRYSVGECLAKLGISRAHFYRQVKAGRYQVVRDRGRTFMTVEQLQAAARGDGNADTTQS